MQSFRGILLDIEEHIEKNGGYKSLYLKDGFDEATAERLAKLHYDTYSGKISVDEYSKQLREAYKKLQKSAEKPGDYQ